MTLRTLEGTLDPEGNIRFHEDVRLEKTQRVLVTLLGEAEPANGEAGAVASVLALLAQPRFRDRPAGSAAELEQLVIANRNAWDS